MKPKIIFSVSEFNQFIQIYLNQIGEVIVQGEISEINISQDRWLFLTLKDNNSTLPVFGVIEKISNYDLLEVGMLVEVYGIPNLHQKSGKFSLNAYEILPAGKGALKLAFEKLKTKLESEGLFLAERKRPLPLFPQRIGLITAKNSQAYADFLKILKARMGGLKIYFYPVQVQGRRSVASILKALNYFNQKVKKVDLLVLIRGGGSLEDLQSFNDERVVKAIFGSKIPVVCGVGHEKDITLADLTADLRASTPSNAAELIVQQRQEILKEINQNLKWTEFYLRKKIQEKQQLVYFYTQHLKEAFNLPLKNFQNLFSLLSKQLIFCQAKIKQEKVKLHNFIRLLTSLDYHHLLSLGYSITTDENGKILKTIKNLKKNENIFTQLFDGKIISKIKNLS